MRQRGKGAWRVLRDCCQSGQCFECKHLPVGKKLRITHGDGYSEQAARDVARNWARYNAKAERVTQ